MKIVGDEESQSIQITWYAQQGLSMHTYSRLRNRLTFVWRLLCVIQRLAVRSQLLLLLAIEMLACATASGQGVPTLSAYARITTYAKAFEGINDDYRVHLQAREVLAGEFNQIYGQFSSAGQEAENINSQAQAEFQSWLFAYTQRVTSESNFNQSANSRTGPNEPTARRRQVLEAPGQLIQRLQVSADELNAQQRVIQLQLAQNLNAQRRLKLQEELAKLGAQAQAWSNDEWKFVTRYLSQSDLGNTRSALELKASRRLLEIELANHAENVGAKLSLAVTLLRLEKFDDAESHLDTLVKQGGLAEPFARALRAELYMQTKQEKLAKRDLASVRSIKTPELVFLQALTFTRLREHKQAETLWESLAKNSEYQILAHCHLALSRLDQPGNEAQRKRAATDSQLAIDLSGGEDWHCHLTHALCLAALGQKDEAMRACELARELAIGNKKLLCQDIADKIQLDQNVTWQF